MKKVSASLVLAVMWKGICQVLEWFFGLFGYKRDGKYAKCVWGIFATSSALVMAFFTHVGACSVSLVGKIQSAEWDKLT